MEQLTPAEMAILMCWHDFVRSYSPQLRRYDPLRHTIANRKKLYYFMTEDLIEYFKVNDVPCYSAEAIKKMGMSPSTLKSGRDKWGKMWRKMYLK